MIGGILILAVVPFTLIVILPTNKLLMSENPNISAPEAARLLRRWARLHGVRTVLSIAAFVLFLLALSRRQ